MHISLAGGQGLVDALIGMLIEVLGPIRLTGESGTAVQATHLERGHLAAEREDPWGAEQGLRTRRSLLPADLEPAMEARILELDAAFQMLRQDDARAEKYLTEAAAFRKRAGIEIGVREGRERRRIHWLLARYAHGR